MNTPMYPPPAAPYNDGSAGGDTAAQSEKKQTRKLITGSRMLTLLCAGYVGGLLLLLLLFTGGDDAAQPQPASMYVIRTTEAVAASTTINADQLEAVALPEQAIEPGAFQGEDPVVLVAETAETLAGKTTRNPLQASEQIRETDFSAGPDRADPLAANETPTDAPEVPFETTVGGVVEPGTAAHTLYAVVYTEEGFRRIR